MYIVKVKIAMLPKLILRSVEFYWYWHQLLTTVDIVTKLVHSIWNSFIQKIRREKKTYNA